MNTQDFQLSEGSHKRYNVLTGEWVLVSPHRAKRPWQGQTEDVDVTSRPSYDASCYLCPGNARAGGQSNPSYTGTYIFRNDFAALTREEQTTPSHEDGLLVAQAERGICKVICYSPDHSKTMASLELGELEAVIKLWQAQYSELGAIDFINHVQIFENKGAMMGCSNPHPHGQIWAQSSVPDVVQRKSTKQRKYFAKNVRSLLAQYLHQELVAKERLVYVNDHFAVLVPWWAVWPFEVMIVPRRHMPSICDMTMQEVSAFGDALSELTRRYDRLFNTSFPYSAGIHQAPTNGQAHDHWHWHMEFKPPLLRSATVRKFMVGYELFGMPQRDITAEGAATRLRELD